MEGFIYFIFKYFHTFLKEKVHRKYNVFVVVALRVRPLDWENYMYLYLIQYS